MMVRWVSACMIVVAALAHAAPAEAQCPRVQQFWYSVCQDWQRNNCWPEAFVPSDRYAVRSPFVLMVNNGWRRQNLLADHHFEEDRTTLNEAGQLKIRWIMTEAPQQHRSIYVRQADAPEQTAARIDAVQQFAARFTEEGQLPTVLETTLDASGWPASRVDMIDRRWLESTPDPRLPNAESGAAASK